MASVMGLPWVMSRRATLPTAASLVVTAPVGGMSTCTTLRSAALITCPVPMARAAPMTSTPLGAPVPEPRPVPSRAAPTNASATSKTPAASVTRLRRLLFISCLSSRWSLSSSDQVQHRRQLSPHQHRCGGRIVGLAAGVVNAWVLLVAGLNVEVVGNDLARDQLKYRILLYLEGHRRHVEGAGQANPAVYALVLHDALARRVDDEGAIVHVGAGVGVRWRARRPSGDSSRVGQHLVWRGHRQSRPEGRAEGAGQHRRRRPARRGAVLVEADTCLVEQDKGDAIVLAGIGALGDVAETGLAGAGVKSRIGDAGANTAYGCRPCGHVGGIQELGPGRRRDIDVVTG